MIDVRLVLSCAGRYYLAPAQGIAVFVGRNRGGDGFIDLDTPLMRAILFSHSVHSPSISSSTACYRFTVYRTRVCVTTVSDLGTFRKPIENPVMAAAWASRHSRRRRFSSFPTAATRRCGRPRDDVLIEQGVTPPQFCSGASRKRSSARISSSVMSSERQWRINVNRWTCRSSRPGTARRWAGARATRVSDICPGSGNGATYSKVSAARRQAVPNRVLSPIVRNGHPLFSTINPDFKPAEFVAQ